MKATEYPNVLHSEDNLFIKQKTHTEEMNQKILDRYESDMPLAPNLSSRAIPTKYTYFQVTPFQKESKIPVEEFPPHDSNTNFTPPVSLGPYSGYIENIDTESDLRCQTNPLEKGNPNSSYIPSSNSDLYKVQITSKEMEQPYPLLFKKDDYATSGQNNVSDLIGSKEFHNSTREQLKNT